MSHSMLPVSPWLQRFGRQPGPASGARLYCFTNAGAGASMYRLWRDGLAGVDVCAIQLPGRETRLREPVMADLPALADALAGVLRPELGGPFAFFGHSFGAVLAAEVAHRLAAQGLPPAHLFVSARRPPQLPEATPPLRGLPDDAFVAEINQRYGGIPPELMNEPEVLALVLPALRADIAALETFERSEPYRFAFPVTAYAATRDARATSAQMQAWRGQTAGAFRSRTFEGDHFYLHAERAALLADLGPALAPLRDESRARIAAA